MRNVLSKMWDKMLKILPYVWGIILSVGISFGLVALAVWCIKALLIVLGVLV